MSVVDIVDRFSSTLASGYTAGGTSLSLSSATGLPSGSCNFYIIVRAEGSNTEEVFHVTNISGTTATVAGAQSGTSASNHASGAAIIGSIWTKAAFQSLLYTLPNPGPSTPGGVESHTAASHHFLTAINTDSTVSDAQPADADLSVTDVTTNNVTSTAHGFAPKSPADATKYLNGAATPAYANVKDSDLSLTDITTNNVSISAHGFAPKAPNDATKYLDGTGAYSVPAGSGSANFADNEVPSGTINGTNPTFTLVHSPVSGSLHLFLNGLRMTPASGSPPSGDYTISGSTITMLNIPGSGDFLLADYRY